MLGPPPMAASGGAFPYGSPGPVSSSLQTLQMTPSPIQCLGGRTPPWVSTRHSTPTSCAEVGPQASGMLAPPVGILSLVPYAARPSLMGTDLQVGSWGLLSSVLFSLLPPPARNDSTLLSAFEHSGSCLVVTYPANAPTGS